MGKGGGTYIWGSSTLRRPTIKYLRRCYGDVWRLEVFRLLTLGRLRICMVELRLKSGSALNPFLFALFMDMLTCRIQGEVQWCKLFVDDIVLIDETRSGVNARLEVWR